MTILLWIAAVSLSAKAMYESARGFMQEFVKSYLSSTDMWIYASLFMFSTALVFANFEQLV